MTRDLRKKNIKILIHGFAGPGGRQLFADFRFSRERGGGIKWTLSVQSYVHFLQEKTLRVLPNLDYGLLTKLPVRRTENG